MYLQYDKSETAIKYANSKIRIPLSSFKFLTKIIIFDDYLFNIIHFLQAYADNVTQLYWIYREAKSLPSQCPP